MTTNLTAEALMPGALDQAEVLEWVPDIGAHDRDEAVRGLLAILKAGLRGIESPDLMDGGVTAALIEKEAEKCDAYWEGRAAEEKRHVVTMRNLNALKARAEKAEDRADEAHNLIVALRADLAATEARAEDAEKERDEARRGLTPLARGLDLPDTATVGDMTARIEEINCHDCIRDAAVIREPRPLTPEVTGEMIERAQKRAEEFSTTASVSRSALFSILTAALTEPPARPEGAEEIEQMVGAWDEGEGGMASLGPEDRQELADFLASRGVRVTEDGAR